MQAFDEMWVALDVETTGLRYNKGDRVIEVAVIGEFGVWQTLVDPERSVPRTASDVHGLFALDLLGAPRFGEVAEELASLLEGRVIVGHNVCFDLSFLAAEYARSHIAMPTLTYVDTVALASRHELPRMKLDHLASSLGLNAPGLPAHRAARDAMLAHSCASALAAHLHIDSMEELAPKIFRAARTRASRDI